MKAVAVFRGRKEVGVVQHEEPQITRPTQVKLRMLEVGICGTDRHICASAMGMIPDGFEYLILGHEALAEVSEVGAEVQRVRPGDLVVPEVRRPCPTCRACRVGQQSYCFTGDYTERGIQYLHGYMAEFVVDEERFLHPVPASLRETAVLTEPLTIAEKALAQVLQIQQRLPWLQPEATDEEPGRGLRAVVLGSGPIGLLGAMLLLKAGFETYVYSRSAAPNPKEAIATSIGAPYISSETTSIAELQARTGPIDLVYEALDATTPAIEIMPYLGRNSIYVFTSQTSARHPLGIDAATAFQNMILSNRVILGTVNAGYDAFTAAIRDLEIFQQRWPGALQALITARHPMEEAAGLLLGRPAGIKQVVSIAQE